VRQILGPVMSEFHYYVPLAPSANQVACWFFVRKWANGAIEVETVVENGFWRLTSPGPAEADYTVSLNVGSNAPYTVTVNHFALTRWSRVDWYSGGAPVVPQHDAAYLRGTGMVLNYGLLSPDSTAYTGLNNTVNPAPFSLGDYSAVMGDVGFQQDIGPLPRWETLYCTAANSAAYTATIGDIRCYGRWPIHYRDETTGRPVDYGQYPTYSLDNGTFPPTPTGGTTSGYNIAHHPSAGYLAYLIEGRWSQLETAQMQASYMGLSEIASLRATAGYSKRVIGMNGSGPLSTRGYAWALRSVAEAAAISPTSLGTNGIAAADLAQSQWLGASITDSAQWASDYYIAYTGTSPNSLGWIGQADHYTYTANATTNGTNVVTAVGWNPTSNLAVGEPAFGSANIPAGATVSAEDSTTVTLSASATASGSIVFRWISPQTDWWGGSWMVSFQGMIWGHLNEMSPENVTNLAVCARVRDFVLRDALSQMGTDASWNFRRAGTFDRPYLSNSTPYTDGYGSAASITNQIQTPSANYQKYRTGRVLGALTANFGDSLKVHSQNIAPTESDLPSDGSGTSNVADGFWALKISCVSLAVDAQVPVAQFAYKAITSSVSYAPQTAKGQYNLSAQNDPTFFVIPRNASPTPAWLA